jgi:hypothetical protein
MEADPEHVGRAEAAYEVVGIDFTEQLLPDCDNRLSLLVAKVALRTGRPKVLHAVTQFGSGLDSRQTRASPSPTRSLIKKTARI